MWSTTIWLGFTSENLDGNTNAQSGCITCITEGVFILLPIPQWGLRPYGYMVISSQHNGESAHQVTKTNVKHLAVLRGGCDTYQSNNPYLVYDHMEQNWAHCQGGIRVRHSIIV